MTPVSGKFGEQELERKKHMVKMQRPQGVGLDQGLVVNSEQGLPKHKGKHGAIQVLIYGRPFAQ